MLTFIRIFVLILITSNIDAKKLVINTDAGGDDAAAILLVLSAAKDSDFEVIAITCSYGNTEEENVVNNVLQTLTIAGRSDIPVYRGSVNPLKYNFTTDSLFGHNGFGDFDFEEEITATVDTSKHSAVALVELAREYRGELSILSLGPTTNLALAVSLDPKFVENVDRFYVMGGTVAGLGNIRPGVEFNFFADPDSNFIFFNSTLARSIFLYPLDTNIKYSISTQWRREVLGTMNSTIMNFLNLVERKAIANRTDWPSADVIAAAVMLWPDLVTKSIVTNVTPVYDGLGAGTLLVDYRNKTNKVRNTEIVLDNDIEKIKQLLVYYYG